MSLPLLKRILRLIFGFILGLLALLPAIAIGFDALGYRESLPPDWQQWLAIEWQGNSLSLWIQAATLVVGAGAGMIALLIWLRHRVLDKTANAAGGSLLRRFGRHIVKLTNPLFLLMVALAAGMAMLKLPQELVDGYNTALTVVTAIQIGLWFNELAADIAMRFVHRSGADSSLYNAMALIRMAARGVVWAITLVAVLDALGFDVTALVTGLGIGGAAIALAAQGALADMFSTLGIVLDKPFMVGDMIDINEGKTKGTVEAIGMKTTRLRSLTGEQIIVPNAQLLTGRVHNFKRMSERRVVLKLTLMYENEPTKIESIQGIVKEIVEKQPNTRFDRAHLLALGSAAIEFEVVYWVLTADYKQHMDTLHAINISILNSFAAQGIHFARPAPPANVIAPLAAV